MTCRHEARCGAFRDCGRENLRRSRSPSPGGPRRPEWMKVRAPSADSRYFEVKSSSAARPAHDLRGGPLPEHRRVLGPRDGDVPDPRRHVHPRLPLLLRALRQAGRAAGSARAAPARPGSCADGALRTSSSRPSTATTWPTAARGHYAATIRALKSKLRSIGRGAHARLPRRRGGSAAHRPRRTARGLQPQHRDRPAAASRGCAARRPATTRRSGCSSARRRSRTTPC